MIKQLLRKGNTSINDIFIGAKKFFIRFLLGFLTIIILTFILSLLLFMPMVILISSGLKILPVVISTIALLVFSIFIRMWDVIIIYEDCTIFEALNKSVNFAKKHFGIILLIEILRGFLTGNNKNLNLKSSNRFLYRNTRVTNLPLFFSNTNLNPIILFLGILISMIFELFFDVLMFELYIDRRDSIEQI